jgi:large subunit ribosomal protein L24
MSKEKTDLKKKKALNLRIIKKIKKRNKEKVFDTENKSNTIVYLNDMHEKIIKKETSKKTKLKIKIGQEVIVISGDDKGKKGIVKLLIKDKTNNCKDMIVVEGVNMCKKSMKITPQNQENFITFEKPIHISNVCLLNNWKGKK